MISLAIPNLHGNEAKYLQECIETTFVSSVGAFVNRFEEMVARAAGCAHGVATSSGTTALHLGLIGLGVKHGDLVVLPSFTFIASANAIAHCGAIPWLFDVSPESWTLDPQLLARELEAQTRVEDGKLIHVATGRRVAAMMPVHTLGVVADMDAIRAIARAFDLPVLADGACAIGARYKDKAIGELADLTVFSFNGNKTVTAGAGGMLVGGDPELLKMLKHVSSTARAGADYHHDAVGYNYRMTNLQGAVGCAQMERLEEFVAAKRRIDRRYREGLADVKGLGFFPAPVWSESSCWFSGVTLEDPKLPTVAELVGRLRARGVEARPFWKPIHLQPIYTYAPTTTQRVSDAVWSKVLTLPCSTQLTIEDQDAVIMTVRESLAQ